jgi:hypothetical protein
MVDRSVHLAVRGLVSGLAKPEGETVPSSPGQKARMGPFEITLEAARPRILPGEENELAVRWKAVEPGAEADVHLVLDLPAEVSAPEPQRSARAKLGGEAKEGETRFVVTGTEPGGVWIDALLTLEDEMGAVLARAKTGFAVAKHKVVISDVQAEPAVVAGGDAVVVKARYAWTGAARVRGTIGGTLRRRPDGAVLELHREKVSALGERTQEWSLKAPVDLAVADFDVELSFESKESGARAQFGKTGVLAVRRGQDVEVDSVTAGAPKWGAEENVVVRALVRNTGVRPLKGEARLEVFLRAPGAVETVTAMGVATPEAFALEIGAASSQEAAFTVKLPRGVEGKRVEGRVAVKFGELAVEKHDVLGHVVADHALEFDGFAADRYAYGPGDEAQVECRVRDDGARPGGTFEVTMRLLDGAKEVARGAAPAVVEGRSAPVKGTLKLPADLVTKGALDLEVAVPAAGAVRRVPGFLRVRQAVASRVVVVKPAAAEGPAAFLFEGETVQDEVSLGDIEGAGACQFVLLDSGSYFVSGPDLTPLEGPPASLERAVVKAVAERGGPPPLQEHGKAWARVIESLSKTGARGAARREGGPSSLAALVAQGERFGALAARAAGPLREAVQLTEALLGGERAPPAEAAAAWIRAAEEGGAPMAHGNQDQGRDAAAALTDIRHREGEFLAKLDGTGLDLGALRALAEAAVLRRAVEAEIMSVALMAGAPDHVLRLSAALKAQEARTRGVLRYYAKLLAKAREAVAAARREAAMRRKLAALREALVAVKGADAILPGRYNRVEVEVRLPRSAPAGGLVAAALALPSELWIVGTETAELLRGRYVLPPLAIEAGGRAAWPLELYVPDRAGADPGAIEVRVGFEEEAPQS